MKPLVCWVGDITGKVINEIRYVKLCKLLNTVNGGFCYVKKHDHGLLVLERSYETEVQRG